MKLSTFVISVIVVVCALASTTANVDARSLDVLSISSNRREQQLFQPPPPTPVGTNAALSVRGGALSLPEPVQVAKWYSRIGLAQGVLMVSSPSNMNKLYGVQSTSLRDWLVDCIGNGLISCFVFMHCLLDRNMDINHAMAYCLIVWLLFTIRQVLDDKQAQAVGFAKQGFAASSMLHVLTVYTVFAGGHDAWANNLVKFQAIFWATCGVLFFLAPQSSAKLWGQESDLENGAACLCKLFGAVLASHLGAAALLLFGSDNKTKVSTVKAFGYAALVWVAHFLDSLFVSKDCDKVGITNKLPSYGWAVLNLIFSYLMLADGGGGAGQGPSSTATPTV